MQGTSVYSPTLHARPHEKSARGASARLIPWRGICALLEAIEAEETPRSLFERTLERLDALVPYDFGVAVLADESQLDGLPVVISRSPRGQPERAREAFGHAPASRSIGVGSRRESGSHGFSISLHRARVFSELEKSILEALLPHLHNLFRALIHPADEQRGRLLAIAARAGLSRREREIYVLLCGRLTIAEIAQRLFISRHTVAKHVEHIYDKLQVSGRRGACEPADRGQERYTGAVAALQRHGEA